jgi:hypothetical protein
LEPVGSLAEIALNFFRRRAWAVRYGSPYCDKHPRSVWYVWAMDFG